jgi:hypothetical protein
VPERFIPFTAGFVWAYYCATSCYIYMLAGPLENSVSLSFSTKCLDFSEPIQIDELYDLFEPYGIVGIHEQPEIVVDFSNKNSIIEAYKALNQWKIKDTVTLSIELTSMMKFFFCFDIDKLDLQKSYFPKDLQALFQSPVSF